MTILAAFRSSVNRLSAVSRSWSATLSIFTLSCSATILIQAVIARDCLKHVEPCLSLFAPKMTWFKLYWIQSFDRVTRSGQFRSQTESQAHTFRFTAMSLFHIIAFRCIQLTYEIVETLLLMPRLNFFKLLSVFLGHSNSHLCQIGSLFSNGPAHYLLLCVHIVISIEVDCLCSSGRVL